MRPNNFFECLAWRSVWECSFCKCDCGYTECVCVCLFFFRHILIVWTELHISTHPICCIHICIGPGVLCRWWFSTYRATSAATMRVSWQCDGMRVAHIYRVVRIFALCRLVCWGLAKDVWIVVPRLMMTRLAFLYLHHLWGVWGYTPPSCVEYETRLTFLY